METKQQLVLHPYDDRSLWYAEAEDGSWRLPLFVEWLLDKENDIHYAHVVPAFCPYFSQALTLKALLQVHDIRGRDEQWVIPRRICEAVLHKAPGITPNYYYKWESDTCPPIPIPRNPLDIGIALNKPDAHRPSWDSFARWISKETKISSSIINAVLRAIADYGPTWLVLHRLPLDLGFVRLIAAPFRANWKEIVAFKCKFKKLRSLLRLPEAEIWKALEEIEFPETLTSPHNIALRRGWKNEHGSTRIDYCIEAIPSEKFEQAVNRIEDQRMSRGGASYIADFEEAVEKLYKSLCMAMRSYMGKVAKPYASLRNSRNTGLFGLVPIAGRRLQIRGTSLNQLPVHLVPNDTGFSVFGTSSDPVIIREAIASVPKMPALLQEPSDMRERTINGDVDRLTNGEDNAAGVSLLVPSESGDPGI